MALTVTQPFAGHEVGAVITDADEIKAILNSEAARFVVTTPDPEPAPATN
jgi:hypothetical protein